MALIFTLTAEAMQCAACSLIIPPFATHISTSLNPFCLPCVEGILDNDEGSEPGSVERWKSAIADWRRVLQSPVFLTEEDERGRFYLRDYENGRDLVEVSYLVNVFEMDVQNKIGLPIMITVKEKKHPELIMESDG